MNPEKESLSVWDRMGAWAKQHGPRLTGRLGMVLCVILALRAGTQALSTIAWAMYGCIFSGEWLMGSLSAGGKQNRITALLSAAVLASCIIIFALNIGKL